MSTNKEEFWEKLVKLDERLPIYVHPFQTDVHFDTSGHRMQQLWTEMLLRHHPGFQPFPLTYAYYKPLAKPYPEFRVSSKGTITILLFHSVLVELTLNKNIRICKLGGAAVTLSTGSQFISIHHPQAEFFHSGNITQIDSSQGNIFQVSSSSIRIKPSASKDGNAGSNCRGFWTFGQGNVYWTNEGTDRAASQEFRVVRLPRDKDLSVDVFFYRSKMGRSSVDNWLENVHASHTHYNSRTGNLEILIHGIKMQQNCKSGIVTLSNQRNCIVINPFSNSISLRSPLLCATVNQQGTVHIERDNFSLTSTQSSILFLDTHVSHRQYEARFDQLGNFLNATTKDLRTYQAI